jgi:hypothetical protein
MVDGDPYPVSSGIDVDAFSAHEHWQLWVPAFAGKARGESPAFTEL